MYKNLLDYVRNVSSRTFYISSLSRIKEIVTEKNNKITTIEGKILPSPREPYLIKSDQKILNNACLLCQLNLDIKHTDILILNQFISKEGVLLPRKVTGLCLKQYRIISKLVAMAQEAGLLGNFVTWEGKFNVSNREGYKKFNTYYDESTIKYKFSKHN